MISWLAIALPFVKDQEGRVLVASPDPVSGGEPWTIGYGATGPDIIQGTVWTQEQADNDLETRLRGLGAEITRHATVPLNPNQMAALVDFSYNLGITALLDSTLWILLNRGDYDEAADQFPRWCHACNRVIPDLLRRRNEERALFLSPVTQNG